MSEVKVNKISPRSGTDVTLGDSSDTFTVPSGATLTIASGATLTNSGTATGFAGIAWQSVVTASTLTAVAGRGYPINTTSNACTVTLPASASVGDQIIFTDYARNWSTNALTINQNSLNYQGNSSPNPVYDTAGESIHIVYQDATQGWIPLYDGAVAMETPQTYDAEYLVIGGGAGGGRQIAGGGGAGGYRTNYGGSAISFNPSIVYTITVGAGGAGATVQDATDLSSQKGGNSSLSGSDITDIISTGGGGGSNYNTAGATGGSGGGGAIVSQSGGAGNEGSHTPVEGYDGGDSSGVAGAGGGGSSAVGANGSSYNAGNGGPGTANSITGASVTYAGGGGGGARTDSGNPGVAGSGGSGGGGAGANDSSASTAGTDGLGGGGGASGYDGSSAVGADGGNGVVFLRVATANYSGVTTGSPTVTTDGSDTIMKFLANGSYTG
jgi:hypothetical protein